MKKKLKLKIDFSTIEPTSHTIINSPHSKTDRKLIKTKLFHHMIRKRNISTPLIEGTTTYKSKSIQKKIDILKTELNLNIIKPIHKEKMLTENEIIYDKYNFPKLGPYIRQNMYIPYTHIRSPFSLESRDGFFYKKVFFNYINQEKKKTHDKNKPIDNKINIDYAETSEQYDKRLEKRNLKLIKEGKKIKHKVKENYSEQQLNKMGHSTGFMKAIVDYAYPDMILYRAKVFEQSFKKKYTKAAPFIKKDFDRKNKEKLIQSHLCHTLIIN